MPSLPRRERGRTSHTTTANTRKCLRVRKFVLLRKQPTTNPSYAPPSPSLTQHNKTAASTDGSNHQKFSPISRCTPSPELLAPKRLLGQVWKSPSIAAARVVGLLRLFEGRAGQLGEIDDARPPPDAARRASTREGLDTAPAETVPRTPARGTYARPAQKQATGFRAEKGILLPSDCEAAGYRPREQQDKELLIGTTASRSDVAARFPTHPAAATNRNLACFNTGHVVWCKVP